MTDKRAELDGRAGIDGDDPMAPRGPEESQATPADTLIEPGERSGQPHESHFSATDELQESFLAEELATPFAADGMPDHSADPVQAGTHAFTVESVCCVADEREWVEVFAGELQEVLPEELTTQEMARVKGMVFVRAQYNDDGKAWRRKTFKPKRVTRRFGVSVVETKKGEVIPVRPVRPVCIYYRRQHFANDDQPDAEQPGHNLIFRMCSHPSRRSIGGAAMSLNNEAIYGCDFRVPHDPQANQWLDNHDRTKLESRPDKVRLPLFGLPGDEVHEVPEPQDGDEQYIMKEDDNHDDQRTRSGDEPA